jgi:hypothetical protein
MPTFLALYQGATVGEAQMVAVSADQELVSYVAAQLLQTQEPDDADPVVQQIQRGRRAALRLIRKGGRQHEPA